MVFLMRIFSLLLVTVLLVGAASAQRPWPTVRVYDATKCGAQFLVDQASVCMPENDRLGPPLATRDPKSVAFAVRDLHSRRLIQQVEDLAQSDHVFIVSGDVLRRVGLVDLTVKLEPLVYGQAQVSIVNALPCAGYTDIYLLGPNDSLEDSQPWARPVTPTSTITAILQPGTYHVVMTRCGTKDVVSRSRPFRLEPGERKAAFAVYDPGWDCNRFVVVGG